MDKSAFPVEQVQIEKYHLWKILLTFRIEWSYNLVCAQIIEKSLKTVNNPFSYDLLQYFSNFGMHQKTLVETQIVASYPQSLLFNRPGTGLENLFAFLTGAQMMLMVLAQDNTLRTIDLLNPSCVSGTCNMVST